MKAANILILVILVLSFGIAIYANGAISEEEIATHWNSKGQVDGHMGKTFGLFLFPVIFVMIFLLFLAIPKVDPLKNNIRKFRGYYDSFILVVMLFLFYVYLLTIFANLGFNFNMATVLFPALGVLFFYIGVLLKNVKRNWFIGIRTPWTLSSDKVWKKTHFLGSFLFKCLGILFFVGIFLPSEFLVWIILVPVLIVVIWLFVYSYLEFGKVNHR